MANPGNSFSQLVETCSSGGGEALPNPLSGHPRYEKVGDLGKGSQGFVLLCSDKFTGERVAIKFLRRGLASSEKIRRELLNMRPFWHAHVIQFYEVFLTDLYVCIVMEYAPGGSLSHYLAKNVLTEDVARFFFQQLIFAVRYCHHMKVANRDIKLENTLLDADRKLLKLCDFGLSKDNNDSMCKTRVGTPNYLAPEIINMRKGGTYDGKACDVWACGVMLYVMLFRSFPFERPEDRGLDPKVAMLSLMERIVKGDWNVPKESNMSAGALDLLGRILEPVAEKRITVEGIINHPWYQIHLPPGADKPNYPKRPEEGLQTVESIVEILMEANNTDEMMMG
ncbi:unnamed protein product [Ostreobium quekettii]|uniref:Protein kinase domain-containing protein n=1 Tax=Ostreobium quekettii TaxID=121088 RepID=A0A8S1IWQ4_9CHLO|nr:unnamed protein product [Ostreobium quekettii]CAD7699602.1 unnamed protein product [Ostreobium quekettii]|eukprot:evm.model.scf_145EXC.3 EVM.evm.TU.scf_145EXC.3   scf_145EXC:52249-57539(-)